MTNNFDHYFEKYHRYIRRFVYGIINEDPDDITVMAFYRLSKAEYIHNDAMACEFLKTTAKNMAIDYIRKRKRERENIKQMRNDLNMYEEPIEDEIVNHIKLSEIHSDVLQFIYEEIQRLPTQARKCFDLCIMQDKTIQEAAEILSVSPLTVRNQLAVARKKLKIEILFNKKDVLQLLTKRPKI